MDVKKAKAILDARHLGCFLGRFVAECGLKLRTLSACGIVAILPEVDSMYPHGIRMVPAGSSEEVQ